MEMGTRTTFLVILGLQFCIDYGSQVAVHIFHRRFNTPSDQPARRWSPSPSGRSTQNSRAFTVGPQVGRDEDTVSGINRPRPLSTAPARAVNLFYAEAMVGILMLPLRFVSNRLIVSHHLAGHENVSTRPLLSLDGVSGFRSLVSWLALCKAFEFAMTLAVWSAIVATKPSHQILRLEEIAKIGRAHV